MPFDPLKHNRRSIRLAGYDYASPGAYFITIATRHRMQLFGDIIGGQMRLNDFGRIARTEWVKTPETCPRGVHRFPELWEPVRLHSGGPTGNRVG